MSDELQQKLVEIIGGIQSAVKSAGNFALEQLPDIAQSYVLYGRVRAVVGLVACLGLAAALAYLANWAYRNPWSDWYQKESGRSDGNIVLIAFATCGSALLFGIGVLTFDYLVWLAPKVWLLKELAALVKG